MTDRREKSKEWVKSGRFAVEVEVEVIYPFESPLEACFEPETLRLLDEISRRAERAEADDLEYLRSVGHVYEAVLA